ncbi:MAG: OFA family MFS transporter [Spirochaetes bacterium]|nr:OFA family MFS transporter [Spirochaetota bacterium]
MENLQKRANVVLIAGILFNLSVGMLYTWSIIRGRMMESVEAGGWEWTSAQAGLPFTVAVVFFAIGLLIGGRIQDKTGPRWIVTIGGFLVGLGMIISSLAGNSPAGVTFGFGFVGGMGIGLGYGCVTPPALKWFHPTKKGMVSGLIVGGFGFGAVYFGPLASALLYNFGIQDAFLFMGIGVIVLSVPIAQFIRNPPPGYVPAEPKNIKPAAAKAAGNTVDYFWRDMIKTPRFYMMFIIFMITSSVGLMIIGNVTRIASVQMGVTDTAVLAGLVSFLAITNMLGRIIGGFLSDRIGRVNTLFVILSIQLVNMLGFMFYASFPALIVGIIGTGMCFGALLSVFPALTAEQFGLKNYGANYGIVYLAWGLSGVVAPVIADNIYDTTGTFLAAYIMCVVMMALMLAVNFMLMKNVSNVQKARAAIA